MPSTRQATPGGSRVSVVHRSLTGNALPQRLHRERPARPAVLRKLLAAAGITVGSWPQPTSPSGAGLPPQAPRTDPVSPAGAGRGGGALDVGAVCRGGDSALPGARRATAVGEKPCGDVTCTASASPAADAHQSQTPPLGLERRAALQPGVLRPAERPAPTCAAHPPASGARYLGVQWNPLLRGDSTGNCGRGHGRQSRGPDSAPSRA